MDDPGCWHDGPRRTLRAPFSRAGVGLHSGAPVAVTVAPAAGGTGRVFVRADLAGAPPVPATAAHVHATARATTLRRGAASVGTVEHLLAALVALGVDDAAITLDGPELPLLDGSAAPWARAIADAGTAPSGGVRPARALARPAAVRRGAAFVVAEPSAVASFEYAIAFDAPAIGAQEFAWAPAEDAFLDALAPARTFATRADAEALRAAGLARGGSLAGAVVCDGDRWLNPPLRFADEPVRHKLVDLLGDLSLVGTPPRARYVASRAGHALHVELARLLVGA